jgi:hypothetical protein
VRGAEWFEGDVKQMKKDIDIIIDEFEKQSVTSEYESDDKKEAEVDRAHFTCVEDALRCDELSKEDKTELVHTLKSVTEHNKSCEPTWNCKVDRKFFQYIVHENKRLTLSNTPRIVIPHLKATIIVDRKEKGGHISFYEYMNFKYLCSGDCQHCMNTRIEYKFVDEDGEYAHTSCCFCYNGDNWRKDMFALFAK